MIDFNKDRASPTARARAATMGADTIARGYDTGMLRALAVALMFVPTLATAQSTLTALQQLTVGAEGLPKGCRLTPVATEPAGPGDVRLGLSGGLSMSANPWIGGQIELIVPVREAIDGPIDIADGPPASPREVARQRARLADGVEEAYAALYESASGGQIAVYGLKLNSPPAPALVSDRRTRRANRVEIGPFVISHRGDGSDCHEAVVAHLARFGK
jgi:hypothetical protein